MSADADVSPQQWRRTSALGLAVSAITAPRAMLLPAAAVFFGSGGMARGLGYALAMLLVLAIVSFAFSYLGWRRFRYRIGDSDIRAEWGLLNRAARSVPYERIQDVSFEQALVPRLLGLVEVRFETGAGGSDELKLAYVTVAEAEALRATVRARRSAPLAPGGEDQPPETDRLLFAMDGRRLLTFGLFEFSLVIFAVLAGVAQQFDFLLPFDIWDFDQWGLLLAGPGHRMAALGHVAQTIGIALALGTLAIVGLATGIARTALRDYGFRLEDTAKGLRRRRGLLTRSDTVMPLHRVQALKVRTGVVRRFFGWHGLEVVSLAGADAKSGSHVVVPFARMREIAPVIRVAGFDLPDAATFWHRPSPRYRSDRALIRATVALLALAALPLLSAAAEGETVLPAAVIGALGAFLVTREIFLRRHERHAIDGERIYVRRGWLAPTFDIASRRKLQSVEIGQGPLARRRGYANLRFGVAGGTLVLHGVMIDDAYLIREAVLSSIARVDFSRLAD